MEKGFQGVDLIEIFNGKPIILDIRGLDKNLVEKRLASDGVQHLYEISWSNYIAILNRAVRGSNSVKSMMEDLMILGHAGNDYIIEVRSFLPYIYDIL